MEDKKKEKSIIVTLTKKETYTDKDVMYIKNVPVEVNKETAKELRITGYFEFDIEE